MGSYNRYRGHCLRQRVIRTVHTCTFVRMAHGLPPTLQTPSRSECSNLALQYLSQAGLRSSKPATSFLKVVLDATQSCFFSPFRFFCGGHAILPLRLERL